jgi:hypothetical protein
MKPETLVNPLRVPLVLLYTPLEGKDAFIVGADSVQ